MQFHSHLDKPKRVNWYVTACERIDEFGRFMECKPFKCVHRNFTTATMACINLHAQARMHTRTQTSSQRPQTHSIQYYAMLLLLFVYAQNKCHAKITSILLSLSLALYYFSSVDTIGVNDTIMANNHLRIFIDFSLNLIFSFIWIFVCRAKKKRNIKLVEIRCSIAFFHIYLWQISVGTFYADQNRNDTTHLSNERFSGERKQKFGTVFTSMFWSQLYFVSTSCQSNKQFMWKCWNVWTLNDYTWNRH